MHTIGIAYVFIDKSEVHDSDCLVRIRDSDARPSFCMG